MARARNIKPGFFENEDLGGSISLGAHLLFAGLWVLADREGRLADRPRWIKGKLFAFRSDSDAPVEIWLSELAQHGFIVRYENAGTRFIQVTNFTKHQSPHIKEQESTIPAPDMHQTCTGQAEKSTEHAPPRFSDSLIAGFSDSESQNHCANAVAFSPVAPDPPPVREVLEKTAILHAATKVPAVVPKSIAHVDEISDWYHREFYPLYPRHKSRDEGLKAARARLKTKELRAKAMAALLEQLPELRARDPKRIPYPATWINSGAIDDEADPLFAPVREHQDRNERRRAEAITMQEMMRGTYDPARSVR